jgi:predicted aspartyl protease
MLSACAAANTPESCRITHVADIALQMVGNVPLVDVRINDHAAKLLLDTGAEAVVIRDTSFDRLGLQRNYQGLTSSVGIGAQSNNWPTKPATVSLGAITLPPTPLIVSVLPSHLPGTDQLDGLLGSQVLSGYDLDVDMPARRLGLYERRRCPDGPPPWDGGANTVQTEGNRGYKLTVPITLDGTVVTALLDTGASRTFVDAQVAGLTDADLASERTLQVIGVGPVGVGARQHRFKQVQIGSETVTGPVLGVGSFRQPGYDALLGTDFWRTHRVWISYGSRRIYIGPRTRAGQSSAVPR